MDLLDTMSSLTVEDPVFIKTRLRQDNTATSQSVGDDRRGELMLSANNTVEMIRTEGVRH